MEPSLKDVKLISDAIESMRKSMSDDQISQFLQITAAQPETVTIVHKLLHPANRRDMIIFGEEYNAEAYKGGLRHFKAMRRYELRHLMDERIFDPYPWVQYMEYVWFMEKYGDDNQLYLHGFVYSPDRKDGFPSRQGGIVIEGIGRNNKWSDEKAEKMFVSLFGRADSFSLDPPYAWYD